MTALFFIAAATLAADGEIETVSGKLRVTGTANVSTISVVTPDGERRLAGDLTRELRRLSSFTVTVAGRTDGTVFQVSGYTIDDIGGGAKPVIGMLLKTDEGSFALRDGDGDALPLSLRPMSKKRLSRKSGAKVWVFGKQLVSGEYQVKRYGVLREPQRATAEEDKQLEK